MTAAERLLEETRSNLKTSDIARMVGERENELNKKAVDLVTCQVIPFSPMRRLHFEHSNARAISIAEASPEVSEAIVGNAGYSEPIVIATNENRTILKEVYYRLFGGIDYSKTLKRTLASIISFYIVFWLLVEIGSGLSIATPTLTPLSATLRFAGLLGACLVSVVTINALVREASMSNRSPLQQTMLLTAALLLAVEALILAISVLMA
jgi:hypothetical protein